MEAQTYTPTLPAPGINFEYRPAPMAREDVAIALLRNVNGASVRGEFFETILSVLGRLADEHAKAWPEYDMSEAQECIDIAACKFMELALPDEPAAVLHQERVAAASMGGVL